MGDGTLHLGIDQAIRDAIEKMIIGHGMLSVGEAMAAFQSAVDAMAKPTSTRPIPLSALRHQQQRIGLFVPRGG